MYPYLESNYEIHYFGDSGLLTQIEEGDNYYLQPTELYILQKLNGITSINDLTKIVCNELESNDEISIGKIIGEILEEYNGMIIDSDLPINMPIKFTGIPGMKLPKTLSLEITNKCNLQCIHCYKKAGNTNNQYIDYNNLIKFLRFFKGRINSVQITGGECMLHPRFLEILDYCKNNFSDVVVSTTGTLINKENVEKLIGTKVYLSLYSSNKMQNDSITKLKGSYEKILNAIKLLTQNKIHVCLNTMATKFSYSEIENMFKLCIDNNIDGIGFGTLVKVGRGEELDSEWELSDSEMLDFTNKIDELDNKYGECIEVNKFTKPKEDMEYEGIRCGTYQWVVNENGSILPCAFLPEDKFKLGNINNNIENTIENIELDNICLNLKKLDENLRNDGKNITDICPALGRIRLL